jgi:MFS superfamily sulfate permease-like transporter
MGFCRRHPDRRRNRLHHLCALASRIDSIKFAFSGSDYRSSLDRSRDEQAVLHAHGGKIQGLNLQSYLFFGLANRLYQHVKALLSDHPECRFLLFDFKLVTGVDSSAALSFAQIKRAALERGIKLVLVHLPLATEKARRSSEFISPEVSSCRSSITRSNGARTRSSPSTRTAAMRKPICAAGSPRFSAPRRTPSN